MKYCCPFCSTTSEFSTPCEVCGVVRVNQCPSKDKASGGSFWTTVLMLIGFGMLLQVSALFL